MLYCRLLSRSSSCLLAARRSFSTDVTAEAFLQPVPSNSSVACLFLNRPQSKNAISMRMLRVSITHSKSPRRILILPQELHECLDTVKFDKRCAAVLTPLTPLLSLIQCSRAHYTLNDTRLVLRRCRSHRTTHYDTHSGRQVSRRSPCRLVGTRGPTHADHRRDRRTRAGWWPRAQLCV